MSAAATRAQGGHDTYRWWARAPAVFGSFVSILDSTVVTTAQPRLQAVFHVDLRVPLDPADVPERCSVRPFGGIDFPPLREFRAVKAADLAAIHAPYLKVFRQ